ncbi:Protein CBR-CALF-1 [Caenorhabditis briggsae]|uniref:Protein CBR-CALF-1 n=1 Tax=Caenorhabditis briggsae TaxID=6238 RepID=A8X078_CAEBR|nr:Protein CBR-CALF-1 [Caenorhabditis briggsae]CAP26038.2 Protein CBR-CALF-1 [Caenorhabditis briggsae]
MSSPTAQFTIPASEVMTSIVLPTIIFCIGLVAAMLLGINKCKQWELDKVVEMRRSRRVLQRVTNRLREKNFKTIQRARTMRKRAASAKARTEFSPPAYQSKNNSVEFPRSIPVPSSPRRYVRQRPRCQNRRVSRSSVNTSHHTRGSIHIV